MTTIKDIARISGYSIGTVSRVLNDHPDVSDVAREKIDRIVKEYDFVPNANAKKLKQRPKGIAILLKGSSNFLFADILEKIQTAMIKSEEETTVIYLDEDENEVTAAVHIVKERKPKGIIFLGGNLKYFQESFEQIKIPAVLLTNNGANLHFDNLSSYSTDDTAACQAMTEYCIHNGHKHIGIVGGNADSSETQVSYRRIQGCIAAFMKHGMSFDKDRQYEPCRFSMQDGYDATKRLLKREPSLTAVIALGDVIAIGALRAANDLGLRVPEDVSITGFDGIEMTRYTIPRLTTVAQDTSSLALKCSIDIMQRTHYKYEAENEIIPFRIMERESVKTIKEKRKL